MIDPSCMTDKMLPRIFFWTFNMHMFKRWLTPQVWQTRISPRILFKTFNMFKKWLTTIWQTKMLPRIFLKIQHAHGQKMIEPPQVWQTRISPRIFFEHSTCACSKDDWPSRYDRPGSLLEFFLNIQHVHGQKMIDPPSMTDKMLPRIFFKDLTCTWSKDDWPPQYDRQDVA